MKRALALVSLLGPLLLYSPAGAGFVAPSVEGTWSFLGIVKVKGGPLRAKGEAPFSIEFLNDGSFVYRTSGVDFAGVWVQDGKRVELFFSAGAKQLLATAYEVIAVLYGYTIDVTILEWTAVCKVKKTLALKVKMKAFGIVSVPAGTEKFSVKVKGLGARDATSIAGAYTRTGQSESLAAPLSVFGGATTAGQWSGLVEVLASGHGFSSPGSLTDSFYRLAPADHTAMVAGGVQGLRLSFTGCAANVECGAPRIDDFVLFVEDVGPVTAPSTPPYLPSHSYHFVIDVGSAPRLLTFGEGDGGVFDNWGQFDIEIYGVVPR